MSSSRAFFILFLSVVILGVSAMTAWKGYKKYRENTLVSIDMLKLQEEARRLEGETQQLSDRIAYLRTSEYAEREVKEKLNLKKPEESVAVIQQGMIAVKIPDEKEVISSQKVYGVVSEKNVSNPMKWWRVFFGSDGGEAKRVQ